MPVAARALPLQPAGNNVAEAAELEAAALALRRQPCPSLAAGQAAELAAELALELAAEVAVQLVLQLAAQLASQLALQLVLRARSCFCCRRT